MMESTDVQNDTLTGKQMHSTTEDITTTPQVNDPTKSQLLATSDDIMKSNTAQHPPSTNYDGANIASTDVVSVIDQQSLESTVRKVKDQRMRRRTKSNKRTETGKEHQRHCFIGYPNIGFGCRDNSRYSGKHAQRRYVSDNCWNAFLGWISVTNQPHPIDRCRKPMNLLQTPKMMAAVKGKSICSDQEPPGRPIYIDLSMDSLREQQNVMELSYNLLVSHLLVTQAAHAATAAQQSIDSSTSGMETSGDCDTILGISRDVALQAGYSEDETSSACSKEPVRVICIHLIPHNDEKEQKQLHDEPSDGTPCTPQEELQSVFEEQHPMLQRVLEEQPFTPQRSSPSVLLFEHNWSADSHQKDVVTFSHTYNREDQMDGLKDKEGKCPKNPGDEASLSTQITRVVGCTHVCQTYQDISVQEVLCVSHTVANVILQAINPSTSLSVQVKASPYQHPNIHVYQSASSAHKGFEGPNSAKVFASHHADLLEEPACHQLTSTQHPGSFSARNITTVYRSTVSSASIGDITADKSAPNKLNYLLNEDKAKNETWSLREYSLRDQKNCTE
jgi:hypothetical protein